MPITLPVSAHDNAIHQNTGLLNWTTYSGRVDAGGYYRHNPTGLGELDFLLPALQNDAAMLYADIRGLKHSGNTGEANYGVGYRQLTANRNWMWGVYGFFDRKRSDLNHYFNQITLGAEAKNRVWDWNANVYLPVGTSAYAINNLNQAQLRATPTANVFNIFFSGGFEKSMPGFDTEIGHSAPGMPNLYAYIGYYLYRRQPIGAMAGPRLRITYDYIKPNNEKILGVFDKITGEGMVRHDRIQNTEYYIGARFRVSIGKQKRLVGMQKHMLDYVRRDLDVITPTGNEVFQQLTNADGTATTLEVVKTAAQLQTLGTNLTNVVAVWSGINMVNTFQLQPGQILTGGDFDFIVGGRPFTLGAQGSGVLTAATDNPLVQVTQNNTIQNITLNRNSNNWNNSRTITNVNQNADIGTQVVNNVISTGPIEFVLDGADGLGTVSLANSTINTDTLAGPAGGIARRGGFAAVSINNSNMTVAGVNGNTVTTNATNGNGIRIVVGSGATLTISDAVENNVITTSQNLSVGIDVGVITAANLTLNAGIANNTISTAGNNSQGINIYSLSNQSLVINGDIADNTITTTGTSSNAIHTQSYGSGTFVLNGNISGNTISTERASFSIINEAYLGGSTMEINGDISGNTINTTSGLNGYGITLASTFVNTVMTMNGDIVNNTINTVGADSPSIDFLTRYNGLINLNGAIQENNTTTLGDSAISTRNLQAAGVINLNGAISGNTSIVAGGSDFFDESNTGTVSFTLGTNDITYS